MPTLLKSDELNRLTYDYSYTDKVMEIYLTEVVRLFASARIRLSHATAKQVQRISRELFEKLDSRARLYFGKIADHYYREMCGKHKLPDDWLDDFLLEYDPLTKYVYTNEVDRRAARFIEAVIATDGNPEEVNSKMRDWSRTARQYGDRVTDESVYAGMKKAGVTEVMWIATLDGKVCSDCRELHGKIFKLRNLPDKPHPNCRCTIRAVKYRQ